jgi:hypothetical protein
MFENRYDIASKLLIAAFILMALYSMMHTGAAHTTLMGNNSTV